MLEGCFDDVSAADRSCQSPLARSVACLGLFPGSVGWSPDSGPGPGAYSILMATASATGNQKKIILRLLR